MTKPARPADASPRRYVSARDVAALAGVSRSAVSRAMTPGASVSDETRRKVELAARALGYEVNMLARGLLDQHSPLVSLFSSSIGSPFMSGLLPAVTAALLRRGLAPLLFNLDGDEEQRERCATFALQLRSAASVFLSGAPPDHLVRRAVATGRPVIVLNRKAEGADQILLDNASVGREAFRALAGSGARRLAVVLPHRRTASMVAREKGFRAAARAAGHAVRIVIAPEPGGPRESADYRAGQVACADLFGTDIVADGLFCTNDHLALGVMDAARTRHGLEIPRQMSVIGCDDVPMAGWGAYGLTTFRQDPQALAETLLALLDRRLEAPERPVERLVVKAPIVWRDSVRRR